MIKYTSEIEKRLIELATNSNVFSESHIARILSEEFGISFTRNGIHNKLRTINFNTLLQKPKTELMPYFRKYEEYYLGDKDEPKV